MRRKLIWFDAETTGPDAAKDRIVELSFLLIRPDLSRQEYRTLINPEGPIPTEASHGNGRAYTGHGITDELVAGCRFCGASAADHSPLLASDDRPCTGFEQWPTFRQLAPALQRTFTDADYGGFNHKRFDLPLLQAEFERAGIEWSYDDALVMDVFRLWQVGEKRTLSDASERFLKRKHEGAHSALDDVTTTAQIFDAMRQEFELPDDLAAIHALQWPRDPNAIDADGKFLWNEQNEAVFNFGSKWKGKRLKDLANRDLTWIATKATGLSKEVRRIAAQAAVGIYPRREA